MKTLISAAVLAVVAAPAAFASVAPIEGSLNYNAPVQLQQAPVGSTVLHTFNDGSGRDVREVYKVNADKTVTLVTRSISNAS
ncbi:hypothetical protein FE840_015220 [Peteryoungia desertarenae]|uniref:Uncharacterized protein n=1 Tax=Peteryoungia desertarenae TaxID=1813451 RepID=A0ABX6QQ73_9HYPH|nr:hypothetical protein [Peteryoungia desertarenae]QLF70781.1 hypothetical protein FE840_015220 [Peteryoungia desertarenae]